MNDNLKTIIESLLESVKPTNTFDKNILIEFAIIFRTDNIDLFNEYYKSFQDKPYFVFGSDSLDMPKIIEIFKMKNNSNDEEMISEEFLQNYFLNGYVFHSTTDVDIANIMINGMNPSKKIHVDDTAEVKKILSEEALSSFFPCENKDVPYWYYTTRLNLFNLYGIPEWFRAITGNIEGDFQNISIDDILTRIREKSAYYGNSDEATQKLEQLVRVYYERYKDARKMLVLIPLSGAITQVESIYNEFKERNALHNLMEYVCYRFCGEKNARTTNIVDPNDLLCFDVQNNVLLTNRDFLDLNNTVEHVGR